jgi:predicted GIY-YIG superfamily endonuclease
MNEQFRQYIELLHPAFELLLECEPFKFSALPKQLPKAGVYLFSEGGKHLYVGRTNRLRERLRQHCRPSSSHNSAAFAFRLARITHGVANATYKREGSRKELSKDTQFLQAFSKAKGRLRAMDIRIVEESNPLRQALLEMYIAIALNTPYNDFDNH